MSYLLNISLLRHNRRFTLLFFGQTISFLGTMITSVALPYQIYTATKSTLMVGLLSAFQLLPLLFTALIGGVFADRYHRRQLLLISEGFLAVLTLLLVYNATLVTPHIWALFVISPAMAAFTGLHRPAIDSLNQQILNKEDFPSAGALVSLSASFGMIVGPAIGGLLLSHHGLVLTYFVDFLSFLLSLIALSFITNVPKPKANYSESTLLSLKKGLMYAASRQELIGTYVVDFVAMIFGMPTALFPAIAQMHGGTKILGLLYAAPAVGALFISFFSGWSHRIKKQGVAIALAAVFWGISIIFFGLSENIYVGIFFLMLAGAFDAISGLFRSILWNQTIPNELRGRMSGIEMISYLSGPRLGDTEAGLVAAAFGITASVVSGGVLCVIGVGISCWILPKFWQYQAE